MHTTTWVKCQLCGIMVKSDATWAHTRISHYPLKDDTHYDEITSLEEDKIAKP